MLGDTYTQMSHCLLGTISLQKSTADWTIFWSQATSLIRYKNARYCQCLFRITRQFLSLFFSKEYEQRGPGFFKFNNSLLDDKNFIEELKENIETYKEKYRDVTDKRLYWEMIKMEIRSFTIFFSKRRAKQRRNDEEMLQQELCNLQRIIGLDPSGENMSKFYNVKFKLNQLSLLKTKGAMTRSDTK